MLKNKISTIAMCICIICFGLKGNAQGTLIHYWHFNTLTAPMYTDTIHGIAADFSIHDTAKAKILYAKKNGTSAAYSTYLDGYNFSSGSPDYDTVNTRMSAPAGYGLRARNPSDSMQLLFYIPTVHYQNIVLTYGSESSSTASGMTHQLFDYSVDSGLTWRTAALSKTSDSAWLTVHRTTITFTTDTDVNNNSRLVFRIRFSGHDTGTSGNNRFDNVSVDGDSVIIPLSSAITPIHYWHFNNLTSSMHTDTIHGIAADFSIHDTAKAKILYSKISGVSTAYSTYEDAVTLAGGSPDYDTVNTRLGASAGNGLRVRNPSDSMQLLFYIPTVHYKNIVFSYGSQSSSVASGMTHQLFDYSIDSGLTWRTAALSMASDSAWLVLHRTTITFTTDTNVNNNSRLVFRIKFSGNDTGTSGNNRFDNVTVDGDSIIVPTTAIANQAIMAISPYTLYPNPVSGALEVVSDVATSRSFVIYNEVGRQVYYGKEENSHFTINTTSLPTGNYFISIRENLSGKTSILRFVKK